MPADSPYRRGTVAASAPATPSPRGSDNTDLTTLGLSTGQPLLNVLGYTVLVCCVLFGLSTLVVFDVALA